MKLDLAISLLRFLLVVLFVLILVLQVGLLPWLAADMARDFPDEAYMRWPMLILSIAGLACVQAISACTIVLLGMTRDDKVFGPNSVRWVNGIIISLLAGSSVCLITMIHNAATVSGPPAWGLLLLIAAIAGTGLTLLMLVMRRLLVQATTLRGELEVVI